MLPFDKTSHHACIQNNLPSLELTGAPPKLAPLPPPLMLCGPPPKLHRQPPPWKNYDHRSHHTKATTTKATNTLNPTSQAQSGQCSSKHWQAGPVLLSMEILWIECRSLRRVLPEWCVFERPQTVGDEAAVGCGWEWRWTDVLRRCVGV